MIAARLTHILVSVQDFHPPGVETMHILVQKAVGIQRPLVISLYSSLDTMISMQPLALLLNAQINIYTCKQIIYPITPNNLLTYITQIP